MIAIKFWNFKVAGDCQVKKNISLIKQSEQK